MRRAAFVLAICSLAVVSAQPTPSPDDAVPQDIEGFQTAARRVIDDTGVPGAGIALVRSDRIEWEGGIGFADRDLRTPVTAATHFRVGSISKSFVALALVQLYEDGEIDLEAAVHDIDSEIAIDNAWEDTDPVRVIHLLQHTAGFDDMHFNETYVPAGEAERSLEDVLRLNPASRRVRWRPGTRMAYSNPGYAVAGHLIEKATGMPYEDYIAREIFEPLQMTTSSFRLSDADEGLMARGYRDTSGPPAPLQRIYLRPAGNMHSSPHEMGRFVRMLLNWGELGTSFVVDPEYLGTMEQPRTTLAAHAGLRNGYGTGIFMRLNLPFKVLGHSGGIDGFLSSYGYSPARDVGFVVLLNSTGGRAGEAVERLSSLALRYLKRDVEPPSKPETAVDSATLDQYVGYYHDASPRNAFAWPVQWLTAGRTVERRGGQLFARSITFDSVRLIPVTESTFRLEEEIDASRVFTTDADGTMVMAGGHSYAERVPRWRVEMIRVPVLIAPVLIASVVPMAVVWLARVRRARPRGFWGLKITLLLCPIAVLLPAAGLALTPTMRWGQPGPGTIAAFIGTLAVPILGLAAAALTALAIRERASRLLTTYAAVVALAMGGLSLYLSYHDLLGVRTWTY